VFTTVDLHVAGAAVRLVESGYPALEGEVVAARAEAAAGRHDAYRRRLLMEPWGADGLEGAILTPPERPSSSIGIVPMTAAGYPLRAGRPALAAALWLWRGDRVRAPGGDSVVVDTPAGPEEVTIRPGPDGLPSGVLALTPTEGAEPLAGDARLVRVGGMAYAVALGPEGAAGLEPEALHRARRRLDALRAAAAGLAGALVATVGPGPGGSIAVVACDADGRLARAPSVEALAALVAALPEDLGTADAGVEVRGLAPATVRLVVAAGRPVAVEASAYLTGLRRFVGDPADEIEPFLLP
jgi:hypothetical protein